MKQSSLVWHRGGVQGMFANSGSVPWLITFSDQHALCLRNRRERGHVCPACSDWHFLLWVPSDSHPHGHWAHLPGVKALLSMFYQSESCINILPGMMPCLSKCRKERFHVGAQYMCLMSI